MKRHFARKTPCANGHTHDSGREAKRCEELHLLQSSGKIAGLQVSPRFLFVIDGREVKMGNGQAARYTGDFTYVENGVKVCEDVKAGNGFVERDFPLRIALARHCFPTIDFRVVK